VTYKKVNTPAYVQIDRENHTKRFIMTTGFWAKNHTLDLPEMKKEQ
jgi:hypothetical protein